MRKVPLTARLSLLLFLLILINTLIFWLAIGSNQMRLLAENASLHVHRLVTELDQRLQLALLAEPRRRNPPFYRTEEARRLLHAIFTDLPKSSSERLTEYSIISDQNTVYLSWPTEHGQLGPEELQDLLRALRRRELSNERFYAAPDVLHYRLAVYLPFLQGANESLLIRAVFELSNIQQEFGRLMRLGLLVIALLLAVQIVFGAIIYQQLIKPLRALKKAATITGQGEFYQIVGYDKRQDEIGTLIAAFNKMSADIRDQKETIRRNYEEIKRRDEIMQHELMIAEQIQKSIFPKTEFPHPLAITHQPLYAVSGDFYDIYTLKDGSTAYLVCDASGHGVPAALLTMLAKSAFNTLAQQFSDPGEILTEANRHLATSLELTGQYLTAFLVKIYPDKIAFCNATHPEPLLLLTDGTIKSLPATGFYVGMLAEPPFPFETAVAGILPGSKLLVFSDGITEARSVAGEIYGANRLKEVAIQHAHKDAGALHEAILKNWQEFTAGCPIEDDVTLLVISL
ncbi:MAG: SpoIIE family protein phosphatase [Leptospiraceae bacterium]|nr:SpoIIE family protein phosphatase [Leptospiraceae bacterium]